MPDAGAAQDRSGEEPQRAFVQLVLNEVDKGEIVVGLRGDDVLIRAADLEHAGVRGVEGRREVIANEAYVSLASLAPRLRYRFDERALTLHLTAPPELLAGTVLDYQSARPRGLVYGSDPSAFLNYALNSVDFTQHDVFAEAGLSLGPHLLFSGMSRTADGQLVRGLTNYTYDDRPRLTRWVLGDGVATSGLLGSTLVLGGLTVAREFELDPYLIRHPSFGVSGSVATPATADIYVNGALVRRQPLPPGPFELRNLPVPIGSGLAQVVIQDAFGREQRITTPFYLSSALLAPGLDDFRYSLGVVREGLGTAGTTYDRLGILGQHRRGVTDALTAGLRMEAGEDLITGGPLLTTRLPIGELELAGAASRSGDAVGLAGSVAYLYRGSTVSGGAALQTMSDRYGTLQLRPQDDRARFDVNAFVGFPLFGIGTATLQHGYKVPRDANPRAQTSVFSSFRLSKSASLLLSATRTDERGTPPAWEGFAGITYLFGERTTASVGYQRRADDGVTTVELQRSLPVGTGVGYRLQAQSGDDAQSRTGAALLQAQGPFGRYEAGYNHSADTGVITTRITGGLVGIGGAVYPTRAVEGSFGLIKVPDVEGVRGYLNGHEVGTTDRRGNLAVPSLLPYYGNRVAIADEDVPLEYRIEARERLIAPPFRGGAVIRFPVERVQAITGRVLLDVEGATVVPRYGEMRLVVAGRELESPIGNDGEFYFEDVGPGRHTATVIHEDLRCTLVLDVSPAKAPVVDLETVRCRPETGGRRTP